MENEQTKKILEQLENHEKRIRELEDNIRLTNQKPVDKKMSAENGEDLILSIVNRVGDCDESEEVQIKVLDQKGVEAKILLCFYVSYKYFKNVWLTTGDIEKITSGLGTKIDVGNVSNKIKKGIRQYLESGTVIKKGQPTPYRLNRKGVKRFEEIIYEKEK
ncbi:MAG: hypothetical protein PHE24_03330 [Patescibacteria group bacterium]|nr:hypothetical protein [Patescibacteria group bacterium]